jgi:protein TonB
MPRGEEIVVELEPAQPLVAPVESPPEPEAEPEAVPPPPPKPLADAPPPSPTVNARPDPGESSAPAATAAAEVGEVLGVEPEADAPLDLTGNTFVSGHATRFTGGVSARGGTAKRAVSDRGARPGVRGERTGGSASAATPAPHRGRDRSRSAMPLSTSWNCGFPAAADQAQVHHARVQLVVLVDRQGKAESVAVQQEPGYGFGALAKRCAFWVSYRVGKDRSGNPIKAATPPFWVTFKR